MAGIAHYRLLFLPWQLLFGAALFHTPHMLTCPPY